jgi:hypothetical protein
MRPPDSLHRKGSPFFAPERFTYEPDHDPYICPCRPASELRAVKVIAITPAWTHIGTRKRCGPCPPRSQCIRAGASWTDLAAGHSWGFFSL